MISIVIFVLENVWAAVCQKKWTPRHENLTVCSIKDVYLIELNRRLCSFFGYLCGAQCTEDPKKWISNVSLEISYVFASYFREHLGKQHRGRSAGQWLMCQTYNDQRTRQIITIIICVNGWCARLTTTKGRGKLLQSLFDGYCRQSRLASLAWVVFLGKVSD